MNSGMRLAGIYLSFLLLVLGIASCAVQDDLTRQAAPGGASLPQTPAARLGLAPGLRPFYDELEPYGDWVLVEPQGWVFRPRVNTVAWRPYQDGHWEPSYAFGWVWESNEAFGWITDHYGFWFHDKFQGWLWQPYGAWAPSWVAWVQVGDFVGWAPLPPASAPGYDDVPGGLFTYMPARTLSQSGAGSSASYVTSLPDDGSTLRPIERMSSYQGVYFNTGPDLNEVLGSGAADRLRVDERDGRALVPAPSRRPTAAAQSLEQGVLEDRSRRAWGEARREYAAMRSQRGGGSQDLQPATPPKPPPHAAPGPRFKPNTAPGDTLRSGASADSLRRARRGWWHKPKRPPGTVSD